jgi:hypothetical protein
MLSTNEIYFLIDQGVNSGSFQYRDKEPEEIDEAINATVYKIIDDVLDKKKKMYKGFKAEPLSSSEENLLRELTITTSFYYSY